MRNLLKHINHVTGVKPCLLSFDGKKAVINTGVEALTPSELQDIEDTDGELLRVTASQDTITLTMKQNLLRHCYEVCDLGLRGLCPTTARTCEKLTGFVWRTEGVEGY